MEYQFHTVTTDYCDLTIHSYFKDIGYKADLNKVNAVFGEKKNVDLKTDIKILNFSDG